MHDIDGGGTALFSHLVQVIIENLPFGVEDAGGPGPPSTVAAAVLPTPVVDLPLFTWPAAVAGVMVPAPAVVRPLTEGSYLRKNEEGVSILN